MNLKIGMDVVLHSYKHDHTLHRVWKQETVLENNDEYLVLANRRTKVIESNGRFWYTKEPSVSVFFKHHWYNVIGIFKNDDVYYYCNISSPVLCDEEAIKYIDYDLDIKVKTDYSYELLDYKEFKKHRSKMKYPQEISDILFKELDDLKERIEKREMPFKKQMIFEWYEKYKSLKGEK